MKKDIFLKQFPASLEYEVSKLYNTFEIAMEYNIITYTEEFYTPNIWKKLTEKIEGIKVITEGVFKNSDRRQIGFVPEEIFRKEVLNMNGKIKNNMEFPCRLLKIEINSKFSEYTHRDFLGSLIGLNIKRELMGDLILYGDKGYIPVSEKIADYILSELNRIGNVPCIVEKMNMKDAENIPEYRYDDRLIVVSSKRLDSIISAITNISRTKVIEPIEKGKVFIDYYEEKNKARILEIGSLITIRGVGKYKLFSEHGETKKGKERLLIKKYI
ncbi:RNA-binding protein [Leptotrichia sp. OH3620_COT-345]|uniref:YlmH family RNA-binding protein n=1 Tax=Leptotrichia sp. OH3620_COT-345 TaxID=2491048 RepID=UPI000F654ECE|nr:YlmH/Sll1252 family protein [Leptotrichia sp. OH3620_COT-345]RRD39526.1 RNA-binding protein [Leptotrichia sp. OH3620_COT-345]